MNKQEIYNTILKLKQYLYQVKKTDDGDELDVLMSETKAYIYSNQILSEEYNKRIENYNKQKLKINLFKKVLGKIGLEEIENRNYLLEINFPSLINIPSKFYYSNLLGVMNIGKVKVYDDIISFYRNNITNYYGKRSLKDESIPLDKYSETIDNICWYLRRKAGDTIDFAALSAEDVLVYGTSIRGNDIDDEFYLKFIKSALIGVLYELQSFIKKLLDFNNQVLIKTSKTLSYKDGHYLFNGEAIILTPNETYIVNSIINFTNLRPSEYKTPISKLNRKFSDKYGINLITRNKESRRYVINPDIRQFNLNP